MAADGEPAARRRSRVRTVLDIDQTIAKLDETLDTFGSLLAEFTVTLRDFNESVAGFNATVGNAQDVVDRADALLSRADLLLGPLAAGAQLSDQLRTAAGSVTGQAAAAVKKGVQAGMGLTGR